MKERIIFTIIYLIFALDYFILSNPETKTTTCVYWITIVVFLILFKLIKQNNK